MEAFGRHDHEVRMHSATWSWWLARATAVCVALAATAGCSSDSGDDSSPARGPDHGIVEVDPSSIPLGENGGSSASNGGSASSSKGGEAGGSSRAGSVGSVGGTGPIGAPDARIGHQCETSADCPKGLSCHLDLSDYIGHKQCTLSCDADNDCLSVEKNSFCIGARICVHGCDTTTDCPEKSQCGAAGWCERTGPGSGVPYCDGFATPCGLLGDVRCGSSLGCHDDSQCGGVAQSCYSQFDSYSCSSQDGCYWSTLSKSCSGSARSCSSYSSSFSCESQDGCYFTARCAGTARSCQEIPVALCGTQPGCSERTN